MTKEESPGYNIFDMMKGQRALATYLIRKDFDKYQAYVLIQIIDEINELKKKLDECQNKL